MRRILIWLAATVTIMVLLFGYRTSTDATSTTASGTAPAPVTQPSSPPTASPSATTTTPTARSKSYTGDVVQTQWGPVQVKITVRAGKLIKAVVLQHPSDNPRDAEINGYALPILIRETVAAQDSQIDMVSGATVTSDGYQQSLQSAIDQAGI